MGIHNNYKYMPCICVEMKYPILVETELLCIGLSCSFHCSIDRPIVACSQALCVTYRFI